LKKLIVAGSLLALVWGLAGAEIALSAPVSTIGALETSGTVNAYYTTSGTITAILSQPGAVNGIGGPGSVVYTNSFLVDDGTGAMNVYSANPPGNTYTPTVGDVVQITGEYIPYHQEAELNFVTAITKIGTAPLPPSYVLTGSAATTWPTGQANWVLATPVTIPGIINDIAYNTQTNTSSGTAGTVLPADLGGYLVQLNNVTVTGAGSPGATFGTVNSPGTAVVTDLTGTNSMTFYYWPTSYATANQNMAGLKIPTGLVNMTGFLSVFGNSNVPEFDPISITASPGPAAYWEPSPGGSNWDGTTLVWSTSSGQQAGLAATAAFNNATFDDTGLASGGGTVNIVGAQSATSLTVSNSAGTYTFSGGTLTAGQLSKTGNGTLFINTTLLSPVSVSAGILGGTGSIGQATISGGTLTPGITVSTVGQLTINGGADFSAGGTYLWKLGSSLLANSSGTSNTASGAAGTNWDVLNLGGAGPVNFSGGSQLLLSFAGTANPSDGNSFWNSNHTWVIASNGSSAPALGGSIIDGSYPAGTFSLQGDLAGDLVLKFTSTAEQPRNLYWSANGSTAANDGTGTWSATSAKWTDLSNPGLTFDSSRPDNATFGNPSGNHGTATVTVSGAVTAGSITFNGSNAASYSIVPVGYPSSVTGGTLTINNGVSAMQSALLYDYAMVLGYSQTWSVAAKSTLSVASATDIYQATMSSLTVAGPGTLQLYSACKYTGATTLTNSAVMSTNGTYQLPQSGVVTMAPGTLLQLNGYSQTVGALSGGGTISLGSETAGSAFQFGDASHQNYSGLISGSNATLIYGGAGTSSLTGSNTFSGQVVINGAGELQVASNSNLGNSSNPVTIDYESTMGATASFSSSRSVTIGAAQGDTGSLDVVGTGTTLTLSGSIGGPGALTKVGQGMLVLTNSNNNYAGTVLSSGTLSIASPGCVGSGTINFLGTTDNSTLRFTSSMTLPNDMDFPVVGNKAIWLDTQNNYVTLTGQLIPDSSEYYSVAIDKTGSGTLNLAAGDTTGLGTKGTLYVNQGTVVLSSAAFGYSAIGSAGVNILPGTTLQLANVSLGFQSGVTTGISGAVGTVDLSSSAAGATLSVSGTSSYANGNIEVRLNYSTSNSLNLLGTAPPYAPGTVTIQTAGPTAMLSILNSVKQYDPGAGDANVNNNYGNAIKTGPNTYVSDPNKLVTINVTGGGLVQLQDGGTTSDSTFGGEWSVASGILEVGPFQQPNGNGVGGWSQSGQVLNALGFKTLNGQTYNGSGSVQGDPDMPNGVTVHSGGMFVVAVDQVNTNQVQGRYGNGTYTETPVSGGFNVTGGSYGVNGTPDYLRNPITLAGGTLAASGSEIADFGIPNYNSLNQPADWFTTDSTPVTARLGGNFTVSGSIASTIDTFDPLGGNGPRTVQLVGGSRLISNATAAYAAGITLDYNTTWAGTLNVDGGTSGGGQFDLFRDNGGTVSVSSGALINIMNGATVNVGGTETYATLHDETGNGNSLNFSGGAGGGHLVFSRTADTSLSYAGNVSGALNLTQEGTDMLVLSGSNSYTGGTYVSSGTLIAASPTALPIGGSLFVGAGATSLFGPAVAYSPVTPDLSPAGGVTAVPEPASLTLLLVFAGCAGGIWLRRRAGRGGCRSTKCFDTNPASIFNAAVADR
jgi:autotransporter-associated beta strand protein